MSDLQAIADQVEIVALRGEFADACMMRDNDCFAFLVTPDAAWRAPFVEFVSREQIRAGIERLRSADFLDVAEHPDIIVTADSIRAGNGGVTATGSLPVRGQSSPLALEAKVSSADGEVWPDGEVQVNRADFGLAWKPDGHRVDAQHDLRPRRVHPQVDVTDMNHIHGRSGARACPSGSALW